MTQAELPDVGVTKVLLATDGSESAAKAVAAAAGVARRWEVPVVVMSAYETPAAIRKRASLYVEEARREMEEEAKEVVDEALRLLASAGVSAADALVVEGDPSHAILEAVEQTGADLIVIGATGEHGIRDFFLGSTVERVVRQADVPVLVVR